MEHPIIGRGMAAPVYRHTREDEYSFILEGRWLPAPAVVRQQVMGERPAPRIGPQPEHLRRWFRLVG